MRQSEELSDLADRRGYTMITKAVAALEKPERTLAAVKGKEARASSLAKALATLQALPQGKDRAGHRGRSGSHQVLSGLHGRAAAERNGCALCVAGCA